MLSQIILFIQHIWKKIQITSNVEKTVLRIKHDHFRNRQITMFIFPYWSIIYDTMQKKKQKMIGLKGMCACLISRFYIGENPFQIS